MNRFSDALPVGVTGYSKSIRDWPPYHANCTFITCNGMAEAEFEDCLDPEVYRDTILSEQGVDLTSAKFRGNGKWSQRIRTTFLDQGKPFTDALLMKSKYLVAAAIAKNPKGALNEHKRNSIDAMVSALERMIKG